ncbi:phage capsid protein [Arenimonas sp.]|uniref:phage capsid protein n=1 Tax=Arenimonas sp. TaxID=1872635 RepID=UPI0039E25056
MSNQITEAFVQQFGSTYLHVAQQMQSRLMGAVRQENGIVGTSKSVNRLGKRTMQRRTSRHADTPINEQPHSTRYVDLFDYDDGDMLDNLDKLKLLTDPTSDYMKAMVGGGNRQKDLEIITAALGSSRSTTGSIVLPSSQKILHGSAGLTKAKIIQAKKMFRAAEADEQNAEELYFVYGSEAMEDVLTDTTLTSSDHLAVQMLQEGNINSKKWMGFNWIPSELCPKSSTTRSLVAFAKSGLCLGVGQDIKTEVGKDPGKGFNVRVYVCLSIGAVRVEEEKVVEVQCTE